MVGPMFGVETEYAVAGIGRNGPLDLDNLITEFVRAARRRLTFLPDACSSTGIFLQNGARFYVDCGYHPEMASPECTTPWELARYIKAGERILEGLTQDVQAGAGRWHGDPVFPLQCGLQRLGQHVGLSRIVSAPRQSIEPSRSADSASGHTRDLYRRGRLQPAVERPRVLRGAPAHAHPAGCLRRFHRQPRHLSYQERAAGG